jgi:hypothetical protein
MLRKRPRRKRTCAIISLEPLRQKRHSRRTTLRKSDGCGSIAFGGEGVEKLGFRRLYRCGYHGVRWKKRSE